MKELSKYIILFSIGGSVYYLTEMIWRQYSHWTMFIVGGLAFLLIGLINEYLSWDTSLWLQCGIAMIAITSIEFIIGCIVNLYLGWDVWDYSDLPFNLFGQISLYYSILWYFLSLIGIILDDYLRYWIWDEEKPRYKII